MGKRLVAAFGVIALAAVPAMSATDPVVKCLASKQKAAGKKIAAKMGFYSKAKSKAVAVDPACLTKAEAAFSAAFTKAEAKGACPGTTPAIEGQVDTCVNTLVADVPGDSKCTASSAKTIGKGASGELGCTSKELTKPGTEAACRSKTSAKTSAGLTKAGGCSTGDTQSDITSCVNGIAASLQNVGGCCAAERVTITSGSGGTLKVGGFAPFPFPPGVVTILDSAAGDANCKHAVTVPAGGFTVPPFCIPALNYTSQVTANGCESGSGDGAGFLWDGNAGAHGGTPATNVVKKADSSDGVCDPGSGTCANDDLNLLGDIDAVVSAGGDPNKVATKLDIPAHSRTWQDAAGCPGNGIYNPGEGDVLITEFDFILSPTTGQATGQFTDKNGNGCALPGGSSGFGAPSAQCAAGATGPCSITGVQATGPCCVVGQSTTTVTVGEAFSNSFPLYDLGFMNYIPTTVSACGAFQTGTCTVSTDACKF